MFIKIPEYNRLIHCGSIKSICINHSGKLVVVINGTDSDYVFSYVTSEQTRIAFNNIYNQVQALT